MSIDYSIKATVNEPYNEKIITSILTSGMSFGMIYYSYSVDYEFHKIDVNQALQELLTFSDKGIFALIENVWIHISIEPLLNGSFLLNVDPYGKILKTDREVFDTLGYIQMLFKLCTGYKVINFSKKEF